MRLPYIQHNKIPKSEGEALALSAVVSLSEGGASAPLAVPREEPSMGAGAVTFQDCGPRRYFWALK